MNQRFDLLAISLLMFCGVVTACLVTNPGTFSLKDWQPLIAALIALGAASLAYQASMAKVNDDRTTRDRDIRRQRLGVYLRAEHMCNHLRNRAKSLEEKTSRFGSRRTIDVSDLSAAIEAPD